MKQNISKLVKDIKSFLKNENNKAKGVVKITQPVSRFLSYSTEAEMFECHQAMERAVILLESDKSVSMIQTQKGYYSGRDLFVSLLVFRKPCKEFVQLYKYLKKYAAYDLELETFFIRDYLVSVIQLIPMMSNILLTCRIFVTGFLLG